MLPAPDTSKRRRTSSRSVRAYIRRRSLDLPTNFQHLKSVVKRLLSSHQAPASFAQASPELELIMERPEELLLRPVLGPLLTTDLFESMPSGRISRHGKRLRPKVTELACESFISLHTEFQNRFAASRSFSAAMHAFWTHESIDPMWKGPPGSQGLLRDTQKPSETSKAALSPLFALQRSLATSG